MKPGRIVRCALMGALISVLLGGAAPALGQAATEEDAVILRLSAEPGAQHQYRVTLDGDIRLEIPESVRENVPDEISEPMQFALETLVQLTVRSVEARQATLALSIDSIQLEGQALGHGMTLFADRNAAKITMGDEVVFDTTEGELANFPITGLFFGREFLSFDVTDRGDVVALSTAGILSTVADTPVLAHAFEKMAGILPPLLPEGPVTPGAVWEEPIEVEVPELSLSGGGTMRFLYRGSRPIGGKPCACVAFRGLIGMESINIRQAFGLVPQTAEGSLPEIPDIHVSALTSIKGDLYIDTATGQLVQCDSQAEMATTFAAPERRESAAIVANMQATVQLIGASE